MDFFPRSLVLLSVLPWSIFFLHGHVFALVDEVTGSLVGGAIFVGITEELLRGC